MPVPPDSRVHDQLKFGNFVGSRRSREFRTVLNQNVQTLLDGKRRIEDDESEAERQDIVGVSGLEEIANGTLFEC